MNREETDRDRLRMMCTRLRARLGQNGVDTTRIRDLPALATTFHRMQSYEWSPILKTLLLGVRDNGSVLNHLRGKESTLVELIFSFVAAKWSNHVTLTLPAFSIGLPHVRFHGDDIMVFTQGRGRHLHPDRVTLEELSRDNSGRQVQGLVAFATVKMIDEFPEPSDRNINMMPFVFGDINSLPDKYKDYYGLIEQCPYLDEEIGKVGYLTVHESFVQASTAQRRQGIHIEAPGVFSGEEATSAFVPGREHSWGCGVFFGMDRLEGGIFMASTVANTSEVWDALVDKSVKGIVDRHGGCEHLRPLLGQSKKLEANELIWMTDCTPHEALPQTESGYRQFFRVVTSRISHWFADHSTPNPLVPLPSNVVLVRGNKFEP